MARYTKVLKSLAHNAVGARTIQSSTSSANYYVTGATLDSDTGVVTLALTGASNVTVDLSTLVSSSPLTTLGDIYVYGSA